MPGPIGQLVPDSPAPSLTVRAGDPNFSYDDLLYRAAHNLLHSGIPQYTDDPNFKPRPITDVHYLAWQLSQHNYSPGQLMQLADPNQGQPAGVAGSPRFGTDVNLSSPAKSQRR